MRPDVIAKPCPNLGRIRFSEQAERLLEGFRHLQEDRRVATWAEIEALLAGAPTDFEIANIESVRRIWEKNPGAFWRFGTEQCERPGAFCYLPLNAQGAAAMVAGTLDGLDPDPALIAPQGEDPVAIYFWLTITPGKFAKCLPALARCLEDASSEAVPIFSRAVNDHAANLNRGLGFVQASTIYPNAPDWLLVILPEGKAPQAVSPSKISVRMVRNFEDMAMIYAIRSSTYLAEQFCLYSEEFDGNDFCSTQFIGFVDGDPAGCIRMRYFGDFVKLERLAVRREYRHTRLAFRLVREAGALARRKGFTKAYGHAREDLVPFWRMFGGREMDRPVFRFADFNYREMMFDLGEAGDDAIRLGVDPLVSIRPEGEWDRLGPLELSNQRPSRAQLIKQHTKTIGGTSNA